jgi:hypothetical protein
VLTGSRLGSRLWRQEGGQNGVQEAGPMAVTTGGSGGSAGALATRGSGSRRPYGATWHGGPGVDRVVVRAAGWSTGRR